NLNKTAHYEFVFKNIRSLPLEYWSRRESKSNKLVCGGLKSIYDLKFSNNYWQILNHSNATFYLLNSYYDNRTKSGRPTIRTIGTVDR
uniref:Uncharacterized protein n=1 Tax=Megaselia scalaris TaxID=36166 RepID=T1GXA7_MEGSC